MHHMLDDFIPSTPNIFSVHHIWTWTFIQSLWNVYICLLSVYNDIYIYILLIQRPIKLKVLWSSSLIGIISEYLTGEYLTRCMWGRVQCACVFSDILGSLFRSWSIEHKRRGRKGARQHQRKLLSLRLRRNCLPWAVEGWGGGGGGGWLVFKSCSLHYFSFHWYPCLVTNTTMLWCHVWDLNLICYYYKYAFY